MRAWMRWGFVDAQARRAGVLMMPLDVSRPQVWSLTGCGGARSHSVSCVEWSGIDDRCCGHGSSGCAHQGGPDAERSLVGQIASCGMSNLRRCPRPTEELATATRAGVRLQPLIPRLGKSNSPFLLRAQPLNVLDDVVALQHTVGAENEFNELDAVVVCGERGIGSEDGMRNPLDHGFVEI